MEYIEALSKLNNVERQDYFDVYQLLGKKQFSHTVLPTAFDIISYTNKDNLKKITNITDFTGNFDDIEASITKTSVDYTQEESNEFMKSVIASNVSDITQSGYFYKKLMASTDDMKIKYNDCKSEGEEFTLPVDKITYDFKIRYHYIKELNSYTNNYDEFLKLCKPFTTIHVRNFLTCNATNTHRCFCKKCAGIYKRNNNLNNSFIPKDIGIYSTLMVTEKATQSSLDSMNKGVTEKVTTILEQKLDDIFPTYEDVKSKIYEIIDSIGYIGVQSRYLEIALLSRFYKKSDGTFKATSLLTSFQNQKDPLGNFIYKPNARNFEKLLQSKKFTSNSIKTKIFLDRY